MVHRKARLFTAGVDLTKASYKLARGRLDTLEDRRVAAIVYKHQDCPINLFVWPVAKNAIDLDTQSLLARIPSLWLEQVWAQLLNCFRTESVRYGSF
jgi:hypothetical protein